MGRRTTSAAAAAAVVALAGCTADGQVTLRFDVPDDPSLQPAGAATLTLIAQVAGSPPRATTAPIGDGTAIDLGSLPIGDEIWLAAEMRSAQEQLVGFGQASAAIEVTADDEVVATIPVRRPFVYVAGAGSVVTLDASVPADGPYQGSFGAPAAVVADLAGTELATITDAGAVTYVATGTHQPAARPGLQLAGAPLDAVATPDGAWMIVGHGGPSPQVSVVEVATGAVTIAPAIAPAERVAVTRSVDGAWWGAALLGRATSDTGCAPSRILVFPLGDPETATVIEALAGISDVAGEPGRGVVLLADRCGDRVVALDPVAGAIAAEPVLALPAPTTVAAADGRIWAVGHDLEESSPGAEVPDGIVDAWLVLGSADADGADAEVVPLPPVVERVLASDLDYPDQDLTQELHANDVTATDLVIMPGGEYLALTLTATLAGDRFVDIFGNTAIPELDVVTQEYWLLTTSSRVAVQRVRTACDIEVGACGGGCLIDDWECLPDLDASTVGTFTPTSLAALFGDR